MTNLKDRISIPLWLIILIGLMILVATLLYLFFGTTDPKLSTLIGGISAGVTVYILGFLISISSYIQIEKFRKLGVKEVLPNRRRKAGYDRLVSTANKIVAVTGTSCTRFIDDFANADNDDHLLIDALNNKPALKVQFLIPTQEHMDKVSIAKFESGVAKLEKLLDEFRGRVEMRRYNFEPRYSFVRVDNDLIVGPVFAGAESKDSPAIHLDVNSSFAEKYLRDFASLWEDGEPFP